MRIDIRILLLEWLVLAPGILAQTTQGVISGYVADSLTGSPIPHARIVAFSRTTNLLQSADSDASGLYVLALLSPGLYQVRAQASGYQALEVEELELPVAAALALPFRLRSLSNVWEQKQYQSVLLAHDAILPFYGPDVDTSRTGNFEPNLGMRALLDTSLSHVIDPSLIQELPLAGRDLYALLITLPGVTTNTSTARGLGFSVNGQRPSASNFLLDGLENNDYLITGPALTLAPEAVQEYRISTNNYSAEFGRTVGFIANAVTRTGGKQWHGLGYLNFRNETLDANDLQRNRQLLGRPPDKQWQPGLSAGGPLQSPVFVSGSFEYDRFRGAGDPEPITLPTQNFVPPSGSLARKLLTGFEPPSGEGTVRTLTFSPPASLNRWFAVPRADYLLPGGTTRFLIRGAVVGITRPDFIWTPYPGFSSPLRQNVGTFMSTSLANRAHFTNEARFGWSFQDLSFNRAQPSVPVLQSADGTLLPGSPAFYGFRNRDGNAELTENFFWTRQKHAIKIGGGALLRSIRGYLTAGQDGYYDFDDLDSFAANRPNSVRVALSRIPFERGAYRLPVYDRNYRQRELFWFAQDSLRVSERLALNFGVRYESFGAPVNNGVEKDPTLSMDPSLPLSDALKHAQVVPGPEGDQRLYSTQGNWAVRIGGTWSLRQNARTLLHASYGTFYDRPFENLWENIRNNGIVLSSTDWNSPVVMPISGILSSLSGLRADTLFTRLYLFSPVLRAPRVESWFAGFSHEFTRSLVFEADTLGSRGSDLITTDLLNRSSFFQPPANANLPVISYRANQGFSTYHALSLAARYRTGRAQFHVAYTWSHSIDNQSEPLAGDFYDLLVTRAGANTRISLPATFFEQYNPEGDRGNSDFDQRHDLVLFGLWQLPPPASRSRAVAWLRDWHAGLLMAMRSGFPYTVTTSSRSQRLDLVNPQLLSVSRPTEGGVQWFDPAAFAVPTGGRQGNTTRNGLPGPGLYSMDVSLSRAWSLRRLRESARIIVRADAYNVLNHTNLDNPVNVLGGDGYGNAFGVALYGRKDRQSFPALTPFNETARQVQLLLRLAF